MAAQDRTVGRISAAGAPRLLEEHLLGVTSMAVIVVNAQGKVTYWSHTADELFGVEKGKAVGRRLRALLRLPREYREAFEPGRGRIAHAWTGVCAVPNVDDGALREVAWWVYPLAGPEGARVLAIATDARRLRDEGPGLALGDVLLTPPPQTPLTDASGLRVLRIEPTFLEAADLDTALLGRRLAEMMPLMGPENSEQIVRQVLGRGYPAVNVGFTMRLPFAAYWGAGPKVVRIRSHPAEQVAAVETDSGDGGYDSLAETALRERLAFLNEAGARIGEALDPVQTATELCEVMVPRFADFAAIYVIEQIISGRELPPSPPDESTDAVCVAVSHNDEQGRWDDIVPVGETLRLPSKTPFMQCMKSGRSVNIRRVTPGMAELMCIQFGDRDMRPLIQGRALLVAPLIARGNVFGSICLVRKSDRPPFDEMDVSTVEELCRRTAVCIDNARLYQREAHTAGELQRRMLPDAPPTVAGAQICYRYVPANQTVHVGGDWFDAIPLPGSRLALVVGDVMGHGLNSAAIMGQLRTAVRTLASLDLPPDSLLHRLDDLAQRLGEEYIATCLYAVYDPVARRCEIACAGHLPPILISPFGRSALLDVPSGAPIGVGGVAFETVGFDVEDESQFVLYTDGLVERRGRDIEAGIVALRDQLAGPPQPLEIVCEALVDRLDAADRPDDDVALLAVRFDGIPKDDVASWTLDAAPAMVRRTRLLSRGALEAWGLPDLVETVELLVSELVTNALLHGAGDIGLRLIRANSLLCEVRDDGTDLPHLCQADDNDENGRGLQLVAHLAERWGTHRVGTGKVVWFEHPLPGR